MEYLLWHFNTIYITSNLLSFFDLQDDKVNPWEQKDYYHEQQFLCDLWHECNEVEGGLRTNTNQKERPRLAKVYSRWCNWYFFLTNQFTTLQVLNLMVRNTGEGALSEGQWLNHKNYELLWDVKWGLRPPDKAYCQWRELHFQVHNKTKHPVDIVNNWHDDPVNLANGWQSPWWPKHQFTFFLSLTEVKAVNSKAHKLARWLMNHKSGFERILNKLARALL